MGFCIACFERDIAGAVGLHSAAKVQYVRPEIIGLVLGSFLMAELHGLFRGVGRHVAAAGDDDGLALKGGVELMMEHLVGEVADAVAGGLGAHERAAVG